LAKATSKYRPSDSAAWVCPSSTARPTRRESIATLEHSIDIGVTFWDTADMYGSGENEKLLAKC
jgi:aryl-alcohol dehydrogenase-like predicted oxidoreductase